MSFLRPIQHFIARVQFLNKHLVTTILFTLEYKNTKSSVVDQNTAKFRDMKYFDMESFSNYLISCNTLNGSQDNDDMYNGKGGN